MSSEWTVPLSEYHRLPQISQTSDYYKRLLEVVCNNATLALFIMDEHQQCVYMNPAAESLTGYRLSETQGRALHDVIHHTRPDGRPYPLCECPIDQAFPRNNQEQGEEVFVHKDGHFYPVAYTASPIREGDRVIGTIIEVRDITPEKQAEQERQASLRREQELRAAAENNQQRITRLLEHMTDAFVAVDREWRIIYQNAEAELLNCKPRSEVLGKTHWEAWPASVGTQVEELYRRAMTEQVPVHFEHHYYSPPEYDLWLEIHAYPADEGLGIFYRDISSRKQAEAMVRQSETQFRQLADAIPQHVWITNARGESQYVNQGWSDYTGLNLEQTQSLDTVNHIIHPDDLETVKTLWMGAIATGTPYRCELRLKHHSGNHYRWFLSRAVPIHNEHGQIVQWFGTSTDITENKRRELNTAFLAEISQDLALLQEESELMQRLGDRMGQFFDVSQCVFVEFDHNLETITIHHDWHRDDCASSLSGTLPVSEFATAELQQMLANGQPLVINDVTTHPYTAAYADRYRTLNVQSLLHTSYISDGVTKFAISLHQPFAYQWHKDEVELLQQLTVRIWSCLERSHAEQKLRETESRLQNILTSIREDFVLFDPQWRIVYLNEQASRTMGQQHEVLLNQVLWDLFPDLVGTEFYNRLHQVMRDRVPAQFEYYYPDWNQWFENRVYPVSNGIVNLSTNITDRKRVEEELRQKNAILKIVNEVSPTPIFVKDRQGRIIYANPATLEVLGKTAAEVMGHRDCDLYPHLEDATKVMENDRRIMETGQTEVVEESPDGIRTFLGMKAPYRNEAGEVIGLIGISNDITDRIQIERDRERVLQQEQAAREAAEKANQIKDEFLAVLSHELRSPLNPILGWAKLLRTGKLDATKTTQALATIERNAKLQSELIEDLLDVSRILRGKLSLNVKPIDLTLIIWAALETVRLAAEAKSIAIATHLEAGVGTVAGDATRLQQVVWNLLSNAVKFTPIGGQVKVQLKRMVEEAQPPHPSTPCAQITVSDTGKGISASFLPYVFDYFRQEDGATTRRFGGLGLGLAIVRHLVELHGGRLWAESQGEGQGATFTIRLPLMEQQSATEADGWRIQPVIASPQHPLENLQILVVDDEVDSREFIAFVLEQAGATIITATSASEAFARLTAFPPHVLLSDIGMPDVDGYMLMRQIRALPPERGGQVKAIALTAYAAEIDYQQAMAAGFQRHLTKPVEPQTLVEAVIQLTDRCLT